MQNLSWCYRKINKASALVKRTYGVSVCFKIMFWSFYHIWPFDIHVQFTSFVLYLCFLQILLDTELHLFSKTEYNTCFSKEDYLNLIFKYFITFTYHLSDLGKIFSIFYVTHIFGKNLCECICFYTNIYQCSIKTCIFYSFLLRHLKRSSMFYNILWYKNGNSYCKLNLKQF